MSTSQIILGGSAGTNLDTANPRYFLPMGMNQPSATESDISCIVPTSGVFDNLKVLLRDSPGASKSYSTSLYKNGVEQSLNVTLSDSSTSGADTSHPISVNAGDLISIGVTPSNTPTAVKMTFAMKFVPTAAGENIFMGATTSITNGRYLSLCTFNGIHAAALWSDIVFPTSGTVKKLYASLNSAPALGNVSFITRKNTTDQSLVVTIANPSTTGNDLSNNFSVVAGDYLSVRVGDSGGNGMGVKFSCVFLPDTLGEFVIPKTSEGANGDVTPGSTMYYSLSGGQVQFAPTEAIRQAVSCLSYTLKNLYVQFEGFPGSGKSYTLTLRKNAGDQALAVTISNTNTNGNYATDISIVDGDLLDTSVAASAGSSEYCFSTSYLGYIAPASTQPFLVFLFKDKNTAQQQATITWKGKTSLDPAIKTVYLQIFNRISGLWETIDSDNSSPVNTDFTLTAIVSADLGDYFDANNWISCRVYQELN